MNSKLFSEYLKKAYFLPQQGDNKDVNEYLKWSQSEDKITDLAKKLGVAWTSAQAMLRRGEAIHKVRLSTDKRKGSELQWGILLPNRHFFELVEGGVYHPDQLFEKVSKAREASTAEAWAMLETMKNFDELTGGE